MSYRLERLAKGLLRPINPFACLILSLLTAGWGTLLLMPWSTFSSASVYHLMAKLVPEWAWGSWAVIVSILIVAAIHKGLYKLLARALAFASWHWWTVSVFLWLGDYRNTAGMTYGFIALYCTYLYLNIKVNYVKFGEDIPNFYS